MSIPKELKQKIEDLDCLVNPDAEKYRTVINQLLKLFESERLATVKAISSTKLLKEDLIKEETKEEEEKLPKEVPKEVPKETVYTGPIGYVGPTNLFSEAELMQFDSKEEEKVVEDKKKAFQELQTKLQTLLSDPHEYEKERIKALTDMLSKFPKYEGGIRYNQLTILNSKDEKYYLLFEVPDNEKDARHKYSSRFLIQIEEETFNYLKNSKLEVMKDIEMAKNRPVPHVHAEICQGTNKNGLGWGIMIVSNYDPNIKYGEHGYYNNLALTFPFPLDFAPGTRL